MINLGYSTISHEDLKYLIKRHIGSDPRTVRGYIKYLQEFGFLKQLKPTTYLVLKTFIPKQVTLQEVIHDYMQRDLKI